MNHMVQMPNLVDALRSDRDEGIVVQIKTEDQPMHMMQPMNHRKKEEDGTPFP